ncbi:arylformamidase [Bradyrhizobium sediminis]|uniref:Kynurenine formamidase n=1 Tax=Bradyrhizobium sediminis TaxID=2840469 RepID=A0A975RZ59_9BRAD|nr:arylformamidase [Bradyrhizobium sediminis]QWG24898.1 arylformamidase [Bradyrhizobium sediminis]
MKELIDISPALRVGMGVFPGDAPFAVSQTFTIGPDCPANVASIAMSTHCGAHVDAPLHYDPAGASIDRLDLGDFIGPARVVDARGNDPLCYFEEIAAALDGAPPRLLFKLMDRGDQMAWPAGFRTLAPETVERLALRGTRLIGVDVPSVDPETSKDLPSHMVCRRHDIRIVENLVLAGVTPGDYELIALPLKLSGLDAAPVRAVLRR